MYLNDIFTVTANIAGLPGMSVPMELDYLGRPLGLQLIAPKLREETLIQVGAVLEDGAGFKQLEEVQL